MRVLLAGGGTAGHTSPLLATADALRRIAPDTEVTCLGTPRGLENRVVPAAGYPLELIPPVPLPRKPSVDLLRVPGRLRAAVRATHAVLDRVDPDVVVGYGGYVSMPVYLAARRRRLPLVVHEQNALPGLANRAGSRVAHRVAVSFPDTPLRRAEYVGLPIRTLISGLDRAALRAEARASFGLDPDRPTLLVTGGSQGARRLNQSVSAAAAAPGRGGRPGAARRRARPARPRPGAHGRPLRRGPVRGPDGPGLRRGRPGGVPGRGLLGDRGRGGRACPRCSCRCRSATASRSTTPDPSWTPGERCSSTTPR